MDYVKHSLHHLSAKHIARDGALLSAALGTIILVSLSYNAEIWHDDYPRAIQAQAGPMSARAKRQRQVVAVPFLTTLLGGLVASNLALKRQHGGQLPFLSAFLNAYANAYAVATVFNVVDLLVLDYLILVGIHPAFAVLPGTNGMPEYRDVRFHFLGFLKGLGFGIVPSLIIAWMTSRHTHHP
jgi:hypothetical protein